MASIAQPHLHVRKTAACLVIGDEILSGRTRDANLHHLAGWLNERGVALLEARVVGDVEADIVSALNALRRRYDYVFTSGGIGPTHDDITAASIAKAFGLACVEHPEAAARIAAWYRARGEDVTPARLRMALMPANAELITNAVSGAPGIRIENVFVMAGVPTIFKSMLDAIEHFIERGPLVHACAATAAGLPESRIAEQLRAIQSAFLGVAIGSYPIDGDIRGVTVIARSENLAAAEQAIAAVAAAMRALGIDPVMEDRE